MESCWGLEIQYAIQANPDGLAQAFLIEAKSLNSAPAALVLGDNLFHGQGSIPQLARSNNRSAGTTIFAYPVSDPKRHGVVEFDRSGHVLNLEEKPL